MEAGKANASECVFTPRMSEKILMQCLWLTDETEICYLHVLAEEDKIQM